MVCSCDWHSEVFGADKTRGDDRHVQLAADAADLHQMRRDVARLTLNPTRNIAEPGAAATGNELGLFTAGLILRRISTRLIGRQCAVMSADSYADMLERLFAAYDTRHSLATIENVVT